jgi:hypothetical protein
LGIEDLIKESPITDIDWTGDGVYDGTDDTRFFDPTVPKGKDEKFTVEKFNGEDNTTWYAFKGFIDIYILRRRDLGWSEKLRHWKI